MAGLHTRSDGGTSSTSSESSANDSLVLRTHHALVESVSVCNESLRAEDRLVRSVRAVLAS